MEPINEIVYKFINKMNYSADEIIGIVVCGSYKTGYNTENSDIDIQVVKNDKSKDMIRGVITIDGYEYNSANKESITLVADENENVINLYYTKRTDLTYTVRYMEQGTMLRTSQHGHRRYK